LNHEQLQKFVATANSWCKLYIKRWITAGVQMPNGDIRKAEKGTPQGGVTSPLLANLYLQADAKIFSTKSF
jgi:RNA-directed DNA polymerase